MEKKVSPTDVEKILLAINNLGDSSPVFRVIVLVALIIILIGSITKLMELIVKIVSAAWSSIKVCFSLIKGGRVRQEWLNRRRQFLRVLSSDLSAIAKAEAWNDQHFTDLEAEVEVEGRYYASAIRRLLRKRSSGLRREPSLIKAIDQSSERCLLLTGDPGAGKSVALRHLAMQMIERSMRSKKEASSVPLYINLREMNFAGDSEITVDSIKSFVVDNVRRGDADTAEYLKQNWDEFQRKGIWFFLFDSFDEIPSVLHSASGDSAVAKYGKAIQQFMDGLGACRGVLASREYKSPGSLNWPKLRILPLSDEKQEELVRRTFLSDEQKTTAVRAVSLSASATYKNPLFLTLLCRYVKERLVAPANEHELLYAHVESLSKRDNDYVRRKWGYSPEALLEGASELSRLFAISGELGLAPTISEIQAAASALGANYDSSYIGALIEALVYVKIGRNDVASNDASVRRFAFSHRRYQECLFAMRLAKNPNILDPNELITNARWREYLVALLQIAEAEAVTSIVDISSRYLEGKAAKIKITSRHFFGEEVRSYAWDDPELEHVLSVFLEAKRYAPDGPWVPLENPSERIFSALWGRGDFYDRRKIMKYCGVGGADALSKRLEFSIASGISKLEESAVDACRFLQNPSGVLASWVRKNVSARIVVAQKRFELLRWEAIAAQLPNAYEMGVCLERAKDLAAHPPIPRVLRRLLDSTRAVVDKVAIFPEFTPDRGSREMSSKIVFLWAEALYVLSMVIFISMGMLKDGLTNVEAIVAALLVCIALAIARYMIRLGCLPAPKKLGIRVVLSYFGQVIRTARRNFLSLIVVLAIMALPGAIIYLVSKVTGIFAGKEFSAVIVGSAFVLMAFSIVAYIVLRVASRRARKNAIGLISQSPTVFQALSMVESGGELVAVSRLGAKICESRADMRIAVMYLSAMHKLLKRSTRRQQPDWMDKASAVEIRIAISHFLAALDESEKRTQV